MTLSKLLLIPLLLLGCAIPSKLQVNAHLPRYNASTNNGSNKYDSIIRLVDTKGRFFCTGFVIDGNYALTASHCVTNSVGVLDSSDINIFSSLGRDTKVIGTAVLMDEYRDVAFIKGNFADFEAQKTDFYGTQVYNRVKMISCGFPSGSYYKFCTELEHTGNRFFQFRTQGGPIFKGMSGGPVINAASGYAIGVNSAVDETSVIIGPLVGVLEAVGLK